MRRVFGLLWCGLAIICGGDILQSRDGFEESRNTECCDGTRSSGSTNQVVFTVVHSKKNQMGGSIQLASKSDSRPTRSHTRPGRHFQHIGFGDIQNRLYHKKNPTTNPHNDVQHLVIETQRLMVNAKQGSTANIPIAEDMAYTSKPMTRSNTNYLATTSYWHPTPSSSASRPTARRDQSGGYWSSPLHSPTTNPERHKQTSRRHCKHLRELDTQLDSTETKANIPAAVDMAFKSKPITSLKPNTPAPSHWHPTPLPAISSQSKQVCRSKIDLGFLVESSRSVARTGTGNYRHLMNFVKHVILRFTIQPTATRVGVVTYAYRPYLLVDFNRGNQVMNVLKALTLPSPVRHRCRGARTGLGLTFARYNLFGCSCDRERKNILVVVTDGGSADSVGYQSKATKREGISIVSVGVGRYFDIHLLNTMASRPINDNVFTADFTHIHHVTNELVRQICRVADGSMVSQRQSPCGC